MGRFSSECLLRPRGALCAAAVLVSLAVAGAAWGRRYLSAPSQPAPGLYVDPAALDFGQAWVQKEFVWKLPIHNRSAHDLEIERFESSRPCCCCVDPRSVVIAAGETVEVGVTLDLTARQAGDADDEARPFSVELAPVVPDGPALVFPWRVTGRVRTPLTFSEARVDFGEELIRGQRFPSRTLEVQVLERIEGLESVCDGAWGEAFLRPMPERSDRYLLTVKPRDALSTGPLDAVVWLRGRMAGGATAVPLRVVGQVVNDVRIRPASVLLGDVGGEVRTSGVATISTRSGSPLRLLELRIEPADGALHIADDAQEPADSVRLNLTCDAIGAEMKHWRVRVRAQVGEGAEPVEATLTVVARGTMARRTAAGRTP